jgi:hypothetical protein
VARIGLLLERAACWRAPPTHDGRTRAFRAAGYACVAVCWAFFVWTTLVYARAVYHLAGADAGTAFTRSWGVAVGVAQAWHARHAAASLLHAAWALPSVAWLERTLDDASVHATLARRDTGAAWAAARTYVRFHRADTP